MSLKKLISALIALAAAGCASTSNDRHVVALRDLGRLGFSELVSEKDGLTMRGCRVFFPDVDVAECHAEWHRRNLDGKLAYLKGKGSSTMRGVWQTGRDAAYEELLRESVPGVTDVHVEAFIAKLGEYVEPCSKEESGSPDVCLFMFGIIATPAEAFAANQAAALMEAEARAQQQSMMRMHRQPLRPPAIRRR